MWLSTRVKIYYYRFQISHIQKYKMSLYFYLLLVIVTESFAVTCPLYRATRDATTSGRYIVVLEDNVSDEEFQSILNNFVQLSDDHKALGVVRFVEKSFAVQLNAMCLAIVSIISRKHAFVNVLLKLHTNMQGGVC